MHLIYVYILYLRGTNNWVCEVEIHCLLFHGINKALNFIQSQIFGY